MRQSLRPAREAFSPDRPAFARRTGARGAPYDSFVIFLSFVVSYRFSEKDF